MAAVTAARSNSRFKAFYQTLVKAGKPAKLALIAVARKLLVTLNAIERDQASFQH
jgi:transposase